MKANWWKKTSPKRVYRNALRIFLVFAVFIIANLSLFIGRLPYGTNLHEGDIALHSIYAPFSFTYKAGVDEVMTHLLKKEAREDVDSVYDIDPAAIEIAKQGVERFFELAEIDPEHKASAIEESARIQKILFSQGIVSDLQKKALLDAGTEQIVVRDTEGNIEQSVKLTQLMDLSKAKEEAKQLAKTFIKGNRKLSVSIAEAIEANLYANLKLNNTETQMRRDQAAKAVADQYKEVEIKKQELIVSKGERITEEHLKQLEMIGRIESGPSLINVGFGFGIITFLFLLLLGMYLKIFEAGVYRRITSLLLISLLSVGLMVASRLIVISPWSTYFIPFAAVPMLLSILISPQAAVAITIFLSLIIGILVGNNINVAIPFLLGGIMGAFAVRDARRRYQLVQAGFIVGTINFIAIVGMGLLNNVGYTIYAPEGLWGFINGVVCSIIVVWLLPVFEHMFKFTTSITLLELADMNQPLLKQLILKAPGTYHHSLIVGNLAESAAESIGANSLLARVGAYYHDIGKIEKPEYFSENQEHVKSAHENLTESMSRLVITNHVKDGFELGRQNKLTPAILDFISTHHGTGLVYYFYQRALEKTENGEGLKEEGFRYPGPKPQTKEVAIVLLADSVEAASRALQNPTAPRIEDLVHRIINNKFIDGQLDECDLTLRDLYRIAQAFTRVLTSIFHTRVEYPEENGTRNK